MSHFIKFLAVLVVTSLHPAASFAASTNELQAIDKALEACIETDNSNSGMKICTREALNDADALLNAVYQKVNGTLAASDEQETITRLKTAQRAWIVFRDAQCQLSGAQMLGGTGEQLVVLGCHYKMTTDRINELEAQFEQES